MERLKTLALGLYWGEGAKKGHIVDIANADADVLKVFLRYLRELLQVKEDRLRAYIYMFDDQDSGKVITYWSRQLKISLAQFQKPYIQKGKMKTQGRMPHGLAHVRYSDKRLLGYILKEIVRLKLRVGT